MASTHFYCSNEGYEENWVEVDNKWTGVDAAAADMATTWTDVIPLLHSKVTACHLIRDDGSVMTDITELTFEKRVEFNPVVQGFVSGIPQQATNRLKSLGNVSARVLSSTKDGKN